MMSLWGGALSWGRGLLLLATSIILLSPVDARIAGGFSYNGVPATLSEGSSGKPADVSGGSGYSSGMPAGVSGGSGYSSGMPAGVSGGSGYSSGMPAGVSGGSVYSSGMPIGVNGEPSEHQGRDAGVDKTALCKKVCAEMNGDDTLHEGTCYCIIGHEPTEAERAIVSQAIAEGERAGLPVTTAVVSPDQGTRDQRCLIGLARAVEPRLKAATRAFLAPLPHKKKGGQNADKEEEECNFMSGLMPFVSGVVRAMNGPGQADEDRRLQEETDWAPDPDDEPMASMARAAAGYGPSYAGQPSSAAAVSGPDWSWIGAQTPITTIRVAGPLDLVDMPGQPNFAVPLAASPQLAAAPCEQPLFLSNAPFLPEALPAPAPAPALDSSRPKQSLVERMRARLRERAEQRSRAQEAAGDPIVGVPGPRITTTTYRPPTIRGPYASPPSSPVHGGISAGHSAGSSAGHSAGSSAGYSAGSSADSSGSSSPSSSPLPSTRFSAHRDIVVSHVHAGPVRYSPEGSTSSTGGFSSMAGQGISPNRPTVIVGTAANQGSPTSAIGARSSAMATPPSSPLVHPAAAASGRAVAEHAQPMTNQNRPSVIVQHVSTPRHEDGRGGHGGGGDGTPSHPGPSSKDHMLGAPNPFALTAGITQDDDTNFRSAALGTGVGALASAMMGGPRAGPRTPQTVQHLLPPGGVSQRRVGGAPRFSLLTPINSPIMNSRRATLLPFMRSASTSGLGQSASNFRLGMASSAIPHSLSHDTMQRQSANFGLDTARFAITDGLEDTSAPALWRDTRNSNWTSSGAAISPVINHANTTPNGTQSGTLAYLGHLVQSAERGIENAAHTAVEAIQNTTYKITHPGSGAVEPTHSEGHAYALATGTLQSSNAGAKDVAQFTQDGGMGSVQDVRGAARDTLQTVADQSAQMTSGLKNTASDSLHRARVAQQALVEAMRSAAIFSRQSAQVARGLGSTATDNLKSAANQGSQMFQSAVQNVKTGAEDTLKSAVSRTVQSAEVAAKDKIGSAADRGVQSVRSVISKGAAAADRAVSKVQDSISRAAPSGQQYFSTPRQTATTMGDGGVFPMFYNGGQGYSWPQAAQVDITSGTSGSLGQGAANSGLAIAQSAIDSSRLGEVGRLFANSGLGLASSAVKDQYNRDDEYSPEQHYVPIGQNRPGWQYGQGGHYSPDRHYEMGRLQVNHYGSPGSGVLHTPVFVDPV